MELSTVESKSAKAMPNLLRDMCDIIILEKLFLSSLLSNSVQ